MHISAPPKKFLRKNQEKLVKNKNKMESAVAAVATQKFEADGVTPRAEYEHSAAKQSQSRLLKNITPAVVVECARKLAFQ